MEALAHQRAAGERPSWDRLALFAHIWALATVCDGARWIVQGSAWGWPLVLTSGWAVLHPRRTAALVVSLLVGTGFTFFAEKPHWTPNHTFFIALGNLGILAALAREARGLRDAGAARAAARERALERLAPTLVWMLLCFYAFVVLHKLNTDFFDPDVSCAAQMYGRLADRYFFLPERTPLLGRLVLWATVVTEALIPLLLALRPTRLYGVLLGFGFHFVLAQHPHGQLCSFGSMLYAVYFLCLPRPLADEMTRQVGALWARVEARTRPGLRLGGVAALGLLLLAGGSAAYGWRGDRSVYDYSNAVWNLWALALFALGLASARKAGVAASGPLVHAPPRGAFGAALVALVFFVGLNPYLGLRTETCWSMFSNLRTEIRSNHLFMPESLAVFPYQRRLVEIHQSDDPHLQELANAHRLIPHFELRRHLPHTRETRGRLLFRGEPEHDVVIHDGVADYPRSNEPLPWYLESWLRFRPVYAGPKMRCSH